MILTQVRDYLKLNGQAPLRDMAAVFQMEEAALRPLLEQWISKGKVEKRPAGTPCQGSCSACAPEAIELYRWIG